MRGKANQSKDQNGGSVAKSFTFKELALATQNFREANLIGEGGFGSVYKGRLESGLVISLFFSHYPCLLELTYSYRSV